MRASGNQGIRGQGIRKTGNQGMKSISYIVFSLFFLRNPWLVLNSLFRSPAKTDIHFVFWLFGFVLYLLASATAGRVSNLEFLTEFRRVCCAHQLFYGQ